MSTEQVDAPPVAAEASAAHGAGVAHGQDLGRHRPPSPRSRRRRRVALAVGALVVAAAVVVGSATAGSGSGPDPSGARMPTSDGTGWKQVFAEDFDDHAPTGQFASAYGDRFSVYHGFADTAGTGQYQSSVLSAHDGLLDMHLGTTAAGTPLAGGIVPLVDGRWGGQTAARYSIRMKSDPVDGFGVAVLLWSDENRWSDGEVDFPEGALGAPAWLNVHCLADPAQKCVHQQTDASLADWHTYTIEWTAERMSFFVDDRLVGRTDQDVPTARMHLVVQAGSNDGHPPAHADGSLLIDWITIDVPTSGRG